MKTTCKIVAISLATALVMAATSGCSRNRGTDNTGITQPEPNAGPANGAPSGNPPATPNEPTNPPAPPPTNPAGNSPANPPAQDNATPPNANQGANADPAANTGTVQQAASDGWIKTKVVTKLTTAADLARTHFSVDVKNGVVTLDGMPMSVSKVREAVKLAKSVRGVKSVDSTDLMAKSS